MNVLIIDSSTAVISRFKDLLFENSLIQTVYEATNYTDAIKLFNENKPTLVLLDINLQLNQSYHLIKDIKSTNIKTKIIALSIFLDEPIEKKCLQLGADFFIDKYKQYEQIPAIINNISSSNYCI